MVEKLGDEDLLECATLQGSIKGILNGTVVIAMVLWLVNAFGLFSYFSNFRMGR